MEYSKSDYTNVFSSLERFPDYRLLIIFVCVKLGVLGNHGQVPDIEVFVFQNV